MPQWYLLNPGDEINLWANKEKSLILKAKIAETNDPSAPFGLEFFNGVEWVRVVTEPIR